MFDILIESNGAGAEFKNRRSYFITSTAVVGILFLIAVVISIYAADYGLGNTRLDLIEMIAPVEMAQAEPEPPKPRTPTSPSQSKSEVPTRTVNMARTDEPTIAPNSISTARNTDVSRPDGRFNYGPVNTGPVGPAGGEPGTVRPTGPTGPGLAAYTEPIEEIKPNTAPPVVVEKPKVPRGPVSRGVINGSATSLPKPNYSAAAKAVGAQGQVKVQVLIDESGRVVSANAVDGHPLLRGDAERAARNARFTPTLLSDLPVKVTGVIVYNFMK